MVHLQPVQPITVFQAVFDQLSTMLASDGFVPGDRLPSERELADQLQVSRPSVREALKALRALGSIEVRGRSTYVKGTSPMGAPVSMLPLADTEVLEIHEFREAIELHIVELAAERAAAHDADALDRLLANMQQAFARDLETFLAAERQFHRALAEAAGNRLLLAAHAQIHDHDLLQPHLRAAALHAASVAGEMEETLHAHRQIVEAVRQRDGAKARRVMQQHLARLRRTIVVGAFEHASPNGQPGAAGE